VDVFHHHEYYFGDLEGGTHELNDNTSLASKIQEVFGSFDAWRKEFTAVAGSVRGSGWTFLMYDPKVDTLMNLWVTEHHLGQYTELKPVVALDMWEHAYMVDYVPGEKGQYIESYLGNLNWQTIAERFEKQ
jgi:Fe-Mn family superoxide dismutase